MTNKELKKLTRAELLEMLLIQSREKQHLEEELREARKNLEKKELMIAEAGSIAEASLRLNQVFEAAQKAADQYLENVKLTAEKRPGAAGQEPEANTGKQRQGLDL